ncbi:MAG: tRNA lysidine(34) synthetase TilS [Candidatus Binataceae bacterium]
MDQAHAQAPALSADQLGAAMRGYALSPGAKVAVAVSGGADSMALALLLADWTAAKSIALTALTVDHGLRPEAAAEAKQVEAWLGSRGIAHRILTWEEGAHLRGHPRSPQKAARDARYALMTSWCAARDVSHLFLAHHADDQVETFLMRLARGSGVNGLAAMAPATALHGVVLARPLLDVPKAALVAFCRERGQTWIEDPSNLNAASTRVRFRAARRLLEAEGLTRERLLTTVKHMQRARTALEETVDALLRDACRWDEFGVAHIDVAAVQAAPDEIALRAIERVLIAASGAVYGPRFEALERVHTRLGSEPWRDSTLHGCALNREGGSLVIRREPAQIAADARLAAHAPVVWDGRFRLSLSSDKHVIDYRVSAARTRELPVTLREDGAWTRIPGRVRQTLPAIYDSAGLAAVPHAKFYRPDVNYLSDALEVVAVAPLNSRLHPGAKL